MARSTQLRLGAASLKTRVLKKDKATLISTLQFRLPWSTQVKFLTTGPMEPNTVAQEGYDWQLRARSPGGL